MTKLISRSETLRIAESILVRAEQERLDIADRDFVRNKNSRT